MVVAREEDTVYTVECVMCCYIDSEPSTIVCLLLGGKGYDVHIYTL
jgi:hypothetical protein